MERRCGDGKESKFQEDLTDAISSFWYRPTLKSQAHRFSAQEIQKSLAQISDREFSSLIDLLLRWLKEGSESAVVGVRLENVNELRKTGKPAGESENCRTQVNTREALWSAAA